MQCKEGFVFILCCECQRSGAFGKCGSGHSYGNVSPLRMQQKVAMPISFRDEKQNEEVGINTLTLTTPTLTSNVLKEFAQGK